MRNLAEAGLNDLVDVREGDARHTLRDLGGTVVDFALIDRWPVQEGHSLANQIIELIASNIRQGGFVMNNNGEDDYLAYMRDSSNGFLSMFLLLKGSTELSVEV